MGYDQLKTILDSDRKQAEEEAKRPIAKCPVCAYVPLKVKATGEKLCPICGWTGY